MIQPLQPGDPPQIGPYRLIGRLGAGGMGQVFLGRSEGGRRVAVKVINANLAAKPEFRARFRREVAAARKVSGLFTAVVVDSDVDDLRPWLATAYVPGPSLAEAVAEYGPLPVGSALTLAAGLAESLVAIHAAGVVHRDLKPTNVLLAEDGPLVIDFGISRVAETVPVTDAGIPVGSPGFMSPEQAEAGEVGPSSDIFSLGAVLAFAATGEGPFGTGSKDVLFGRVLSGLPNLDHVPDELRPLVKRCMAKEPSLRPSAREILSEVGPAQPVPGWLPEPVTRAYANDRAPVDPGATTDSPGHLEDHASTQAPAVGAQDSAQTGLRPSDHPIAHPQSSGGPIYSGVPRQALRRSRPRPLALTGIIVALLLAAAAAGLVLISGTSHTTAQNSAPISPSQSQARVSHGKTAQGWVFNTVDSIDSSPAVADGIVYVGDDNGNVYAIDAATGTPRWKVSTGSTVMSRPAVVGGTVYFGSENNDVYAVNAATGVILWKCDTGQTVDSSPAVAGGVVYIGSDNNEVFAIDAATGTVRWTQQTGQNVYSSPAVSDGTVYVGSEDNSVYAMNAATGAIKWSRLTGGEVDSSPAVSGGTVYVGSDDDRVYALSAATGAIEWTRLTGGSVESSPTVSNGTVYVGSDDGKVYALNAATGAIEWTRPTEGEVISSPAVSDGFVYVGSYDGNVYALDAATGVVRWKRQTGGEVISSPVVSDGFVYVGTDNDAVYAINAATGS